MKISNFNYCCKPLVYAIALIWIWSACTTEQNKNQNAFSDTEMSEAQFISVIQSIDTIRGRVEINEYCDSLLSLTQSGNTVLEKNLHTYILAHKQLFINNRDSAVTLISQMQPDTGMHQIIALKELTLLQIGLAENISPKEQMEKILEATKYAEQHESRLLYSFYDLMAQAYFVNGNFDRAEEFIEKSNAYHPFGEQHENKLRYLMNSMYILMEQQDTARLKEKILDFKAIIKLPEDSVEANWLPEIELAYAKMRNNYTEAKSKEVLKAALLLLRQRASVNTVDPIVLRNVGNSYNAVKMYDSAIVYFQKALAMGNTEHFKINMEYIFQGLVNAYKGKGDYNKAFTALDSLHKIKITNINLIGAQRIEEIQSKYQAEKKDAQIALLSSTNQLNKKIIKQQRWIFVTGAILLLSLLLFIYIGYRRRLLKAINAKLTLENQTLKLEQKMRQMHLNPHFIYNTITNLQGLIITDRKKEANNYLVNFSRLMRSVLEQNRNEYISVEEEIGSLSNYVKLQQMRFDHSFKCEIKNEVHENQDEILLPPMLLQPFVENAIEHGLQNLDYEGYLSILFEELDGHLHIQILDNGSGESQTEKVNSEKKSLSRIITQERLDILFNQSETQAWFTTGPANAAENKGFVVHVHLPLIKVQ